MVCDRSARASRWREAVWGDKNDPSSCSHRWHRRRRFCSVRNTGARATILAQRTCLRVAARLRECNENQWRRGERHWRCSRSINWIIGFGSQSWCWLGSRCNRGRHNRWTGGRPRHLPSGRPSHSCQRANCALSYWRLRIGRRQALRPVRTIGDDQSGTTLPYRVWLGNIALVVTSRTIAKLARRPSFGEITMSHQLQGMSGVIGADESRKSALGPRLAQISQ